MLCVWVTIKNALGAAVARFSASTIAYAAMRGLAEDELPLIIDGCSGGISWLYAIGGKHISCEDCCNIHDIDYQLGGTAAERKTADLQLRDCAAASAANSGWLVRSWSTARAWVMYVAVRMFGGRYWA